MNLRTVLRLISNRLGQQERFYTHEDVIRELRKDYSELLTAHSRKLEDIALKRLLTDVDAKRVRNFEPTQGNLFAELAGIPVSFNAKKFGLSDEKTARILSTNLSIRHLRSLIETSEKPQQPSTFKKTLIELLERIEPHIDSEEDIISDVIAKIKKD